MLLAVCVLIQRQDGFILAISRPSVPDDMGLIGGGVEPEDGDPVADRDGTLRRAAVRELREEAGISVPPERLTPIFEGMGRTRWAVTFRVQGALPAPVLGENPEGMVRWVPPSTVMRGSFATYNRALFAALQREASA
jgi:8-oxo-dGTP pyrophosphatase MutT (NUDIX family)